MVLSGSRHVSVLLGEVMNFLQPERGGNFLDCTFGGGGHSGAILDANAENRLVACDRDARALERAEKTWPETLKERTRFVHSAFSELSENLAGESFDGVLADLGVSTDQLFEERGFSFKDSDSLDMRMDESRGRSARELIDSLSKPELTKLLRRGGLGKEASAVANAIEREKPIENAQQLADIVSPVMRRFYPDKKVHPATTVMQALRIAVNEEFEEIEAMLDFAVDALKPGGVLAVISFHSLEDKIVARRFRDLQGSTAPANWAGAADSTASKGKHLTSKAVKPSKEECEANPAARSALLRAFQKTTEELA